MQSGTEAKEGVDEKRAVYLNVMLDPSGSAFFALIKKKRRRTNSVRSVSRIFLCIYFLLYAFTSSSTRVFQGSRKLLQGGVWERR